MDAGERSSVEEATVYEGFMSYSHAADGMLAPRLQAGLQRFAKPWWKRRALRVFRDETSLSANPHLWSSIVDALDQSGWFVLLLSPEAAQSEWVNQEIEYWKEHKNSDRILPVLTDGTFDWIGGDVSGNAVPEQLNGVFSEEPRWVDLRFAGDEDQLDLKNPRFSDAVADIASALRGVPKDELESEEVRQHRRTIRTAWAAAALLVLFGIAAGAFAIQSANNAQLAEARELAAASIANLERSPELASLLALQALEEAPDSDDTPAELVNAVWRAGSSNRLVEVIETGHDGDLSLSTDGNRLATTVAPNKLRMYEPSTDEMLWEYSEETFDHFVYPVVGPDGRVALGVYDSAIEWGGAVEGRDELPNRVVILTSSGAREATLEFPDCFDVGNSDWSHDGRFLAVGFGESGCARNGYRQWIEVFDTSTWESIAFLSIEGDQQHGPSPRFDGNGTLYALRGFERTVIFEAETFRQVEMSDATGIGDVTPDGSRILGFYTLHGREGRGGTGFSVTSFHTDSGQIADILYTGTRYPWVPFGVTATDDGKYVIVAVHGTTTHMFDPLTGEERLRLPTDSVETIGYDSTRELLYTDGSDAGPRVWDLGASSVGVTSSGDLGEFTWVNGQSFAIGPRNIGTFQQIDMSSGSWQTGLFDLTTGQIVGSVPDAVGFGGTALANGAFVLNLFDAFGVYHPDTGEMHRFFECEEFEESLMCLDDGYHVVVSSNGTEFLAYPWADDGTLAGEVHSLDLDTGAIVRTDRIGDDQIIPEIVTNSWMVGTSTGRTDHPRAVDRLSDEILWEDQRDRNRIDVSNDERWLLTGGGDEVQVVETGVWNVKFSVEGFNNIRGTAFSDDGNLIAVSDEDSMRIIDVETGLIAQQAQLPGVSDMYFLDDETLVIGTTDGIFGIVSISTAELIERTSAGLRRSFTEQECDLYRIDPCPTLDELRSGG